LCWRIRQVAEGARERDDEHVPAWAKEVERSVVAREAWAIVVQPVHCDDQAEPAAGGGGPPHITKADLPGGLAAFSKTSGEQVGGWSWATRKAPMAGRNRYA